MKASDVMVHKVITTHPQASVHEAAKLLAENDVSALPVVDDQDHIVGVISEADLIHRQELNTVKRRPWWVEAVTPAAILTGEFAQSHGKKVEEIMSRAVISATKDTPLSDVAILLERHRVKRLPIIDKGKLVGIVGRSNLVQALASASDGGANQADGDRMIRSEIIAELAEQPWTDFGDRNVVVVDGVVHLWGLVGSPEERKALTALAEGVRGVIAARDEMFPAY